MVPCAKMTIFYASNARNAFSVAVPLLLKDADQKPTLRLTFGHARHRRGPRRAIIGFYKQPNVDWTRPFEVQLKGIVATRPQTPNPPGGQRERCWMAYTSGGFSIEEREEDPP